MAEEILKEKAHDVSSLRLIPGSKGVFEVIAGRRTVFSKKELGRHPEPGEVLKAL